LSDAARGHLNLTHLCLGIRTGWVEEHGHRRRIWRQFAQKLQSLCRQTR
jgi:hypothetical protein